MLRVGRSTPPASPAKGGSAVEKALAAARSEVQSTVLRGADDLTFKLGAWKELADGAYGSAPPSAMLTVTVMAATGLSTAEPYWIAAVAGATAETGAPTHYQVAHFHEAIGGNTAAAAPRGAPSWSAEPLVLPVHDVTADLLLLLCEDAVSGRRCIGRVVLPLVDLLPLNPMADFVGAQPAARQVWAQVFPAASENAQGQIDARLAPPLRTRRDRGHALRGGGGAAAAWRARLRFGVVRADARRAVAQLGAPHRRQRRARPVRRADARQHQPRRHEPLAEAARRANAGAPRARAGGLPAGRPEAVVAVEGRAALRVSEGWGGVGRGRRRRRA